MLNRMRKSIFISFTCQLQTGEEWQGLSYCTPSLSPKTTAQELSQQHSHSNNYYTYQGPLTLTMGESWS